MISVRTADRNRERSDTERRKETESLGGLDGVGATRPGSSVYFLLSPFYFLRSGEGARYEVWLAVDGMTRPGSA